MIGKPQLKKLVRFILWFGLIYGLLIYPWPGLDDAYNRYFRVIGQMAFPEHSGNRILQFGSCEMRHDFYCIRTQITLGNRDQTNPDGTLPVKNLGIDARGVGWIPTALTIALILPSPVSWKRKLVALAWGLIFVHLFIWFSVWAYIWNQSDAIGLVTLSPTWKEIAGALEETLITQMEVSFAAPVLIWMLVTFGRDDLYRIISSEEKKAVERAT